MEKQPLRFRIRISLLVNLLLLIVMLAGTMLLVSFLSGGRVMQEMVKTYMDQSTTLMRSELDSFFTPINQSIRQTQQWSASGLFNPHNRLTANQIYLPILHALPQVTSIASGYPDGFSYRIGWEGEDILTRFSYAEEPNRLNDFSLWNRHGQLLREWSEAYYYDARDRSWYLGALEGWQSVRRDVLAAPLFWADPFRLNTSRLPAISVSLPAHDGEGRLYMTTFNVMLTKLSLFTSQLYPSPSGKAFLLTETAQVIGFPASPDWDSEEKLAQRLAKTENLPRIHELNMASLTAAATAWREQPDRQQQQHHFRYLSSDGTAWWASFNPYPLSATRILWMGVVTPESDFLGEFRYQQMVIGVTALIAMVLAILMAVLLSRAFSRPVQQLVEQINRSTLLDLRPYPPIQTRLLETWQLAEAHERMRVALESFARYVPTALVKQLLQQGEAAKLGGRTRELTIMFTDIRGFTTLSEQMEPNQLSHHLASYFSFMLDTVAEHYGTVDKMVGDAIMAFWGAPQSDAQHAFRAVSAALACVERLHRFNSFCRHESHLPPLETGFGLSTGQVMVGNVGTVDRLNYTALGDHVNLAARLEGANKLYGTSILVSESVRDQVRDLFYWRFVDLVAVKGKHEPVRIYEPLGLKGAVPPVSLERLEFARQYERAFSAYLWCDFSHCLAILAQLQLNYPQDPSIQNLIHAASHWLVEPPPEDWDGVNRLLSK